MTHYTPPFVTDLLNTSHTLRDVADDISDRFRDAATYIVDGLKCGGTVYACGNGGSAAQADHLVAELLGRFEVERPPLRAVSLTHPATVTAIGNDFGYEEVFARQIEFIEEDDVLVCLSTSGTSANVQRAMEVAIDRGACIILISGRVDLDGITIAKDWEDGGPLTFPGVHLEVPSTHTATVQEVTLSLIHALCRAIDYEFSAEVDDDDA